MEENHKMVEFKGQPANQLLEQIRATITDREVQKICLFISFKPKKQKHKIKAEKNLQQKTYEALSSAKEKRTFDEMLQNMKSSFREIKKQQLPFAEQISRLYEEGEYNKAIDILKQKQAQFKDKFIDVAEPEIQKNRFQYNFITFSIGNCYFRLKDYTKAADYYQKSKPDQPIRQHAQRMNNLGTCYAIKGTYQQALKAYNEAVKFYGEIPEEDVSSLLNNIAMIYLKCEMHKTAQQYFHQSINQRKNKSPNNRAMLYNSYFNLGICQRKCKKLEQSINTLFIALNYAFDGFGKKVDVLNQICLVYEEQQKWSQALSYYEKLSEEYEILRKPQGAIFERVSKIHQKLGNTLLAAKFAKKAFKIYYEQGNQRKMSQMSASPLVNMPNN